MTVPHDLHPRGERGAANLSRLSWETLEEKHFDLDLVRCWYNWKNEIPRSYAAKEPNLQTRERFGVFRDMNVAIISLK